MSFLRQIYGLSMFSLFRKQNAYVPESRNEEGRVVTPTSYSIFDLMTLTLLGLGLMKINTVSANFNNPRPSLILNN